MPRPPEIYLKDILQSIDKISEYVANLSKDDFSDDNLRIDAVLHNLIIIGEAAKHIPDDVRSEIDTIEWRKIAGFRDIAVHQYFRVNINIVWDIIENRLPKLKLHISDYLQSNKSSED